MAFWGGSVLKALARLDEQTPFGVRPQRPSLCGQPVAGQAQFPGRRPGAVGSFLCLPGASSKRRTGVRWDVRGREET